MNIFQKALRLIGAGGSGGNNLSNGNSEYSGSFLTSVGASTQWWQRYEDERWGHKASADTSALVRGAVDTVATKIASMNLRHERRDPATGVYKAVNGGTQAILDRPCPGLTQSDFIAHLVTELLYFGNTFWAKQVDPRTQRPTSLHPLPPRTQVLLGDGGEIFYESPHLYAEGIFPQPLEDRHLFPERYVAHVRVTDPHNPWVGKSPLSACGIAIHLDDVAKNQAANFLGNKHRVSGFLSTDERLGRDQIMQLRQAFQAQSQGINQGNLPVLGDGLKYQQITNDHTIEIRQVTDISARDISAALRVPLPFLGVLQDANFSNISALEAHFVSSLRYYLRNIEETLARTFELGANDRFRFDFEAAIAPPGLKDRIEALGIATRSGLMTLNEARLLLPEEMSPLDGGDDLFLQAQMVPARTVTNPPEPEPVVIPAPEPEPEPDAKALQKMMRAELHELRANNKRLN